MRRLAAAVLACLAACGPGDPPPPAGPTGGALPGRPASEHVRRAGDLLAGDRLADAAAEYRAALTQDSANVAALEGLSRIAARMHDGPASLGFIARAAELRPEDGAIVNQLGVAQVANGRKREAAATFERAMVLRPRDALVLLNAAQNQADLGDWARARGYAERAAVLIPEDATPWLLLGRFQMRQEKFAEAVAPLREAARRAPDQAMIQYYLGKSLAAAGRRQEAEEPLRAVLRGQAPPEIRREVESLLAR
ncbi:MAG TPA: tetratricopeptide repeat protein [Planctomycetota bacterium]|nr:tetratricopeptide repeat protein [Planctomycetota bacterium]